MSVFNFKRYFSARRARSITNRVNLERDQESLQMILTKIEDTAKTGETFFEAIVSTQTKWIEKKLIKLGYSVKSDYGFGSDMVSYNINW